MSRTTRAVGSAFLLACLLWCAACGGTKDSKPAPRAAQDKKIEQQDAKRAPYTPVNDVEFNNFNDAQKLYDSPTTILWCTAFPNNPNAPFITTPIAGKLTSSSVSYQPQQSILTHEISGDSLGPVVAGIGDAKSSDGMYHGSPPPYRYGFTPGGVYIDYTDIPTVCTTALTKFTRENSTLAVTVDQQVKQATDQAEAALKRGNKSEAQRILSTLDSSK